MVERPPTFNELLIREVQNHPELYDQQHRVCTDNEERNLMWEMIARKIDHNVTGEFAKKRWLQMRDRYRKELKMALRNMIKPKWPYFERLKWLDPYLKDAKSAGLNPLFLSSSFEGLDGQTSVSALESLIKESETTDLHDLQQYANANALLENIMAASSSAFEQLQRQRETGEFSPDSATTSDDGDLIQSTGIQLINSAESTAASDAGSSASGTSDTTRQRNSSSPERQSGDETISGIENQNLLEPTTLDTAGLLSASALTASAENLSFVGSMIRNLNASLLPTQQPLRPNTRQRNPPYLVRRGGGIKLKPADPNIQSTQSTPTDRTRGLSAFRPLSKTMSVGGMNGNVLQQLNAERDVSLMLDELKTAEWSNDEDACFARLVVVRLRKFAAKEKRTIRARISDLLDKQEEAIDETQMQ
ncbi:MADF domain-containing protein [Aphelenchoides besseyi]|nr:MADF domain-containing protein [Aphelenchoides besseyi]KAI6194486.1 MADF domain-containing protein [Aphelenchoides besseyi]